MPLPKYQTAIEIINEVIVPQIDTNAQDIKAIAKEVVSNAKDFDKKVEEVYNALEAKEVETGGLFDTHKAGYTKYCDDLKAEIEKLTTQITSDTSTQDIGEIVDVLSSKIEALENEENFEYDDQELKDSITKLNVDFSVFKEKVLTSKSVIDEINSKEGVIEASSIKGLIQTLNDIANKGGNSNVKVGASILEILSNGTSVMQGATRLNFIGSTVAYNKGTIDITSSGGGSGTPGGSTTQLQYNNAGSFGGISGATTNGTSVTLTSPTFITPALGTPASGVATNLTGTAAGLTAGNVTTNANLTGVVTSTGNATAIADAALSIAKTSGLQAALDSKQATGNYITALTGDVTASGPGSAASTLATVNSNVGSFGSATQSLTATVNAKGLVTAISAQTVTPAVGSITGLGTGVATALAVNVGTAGAPVVNGGALGTPSSGTVTNLTGTASININGTVGATTPTTGSFTTVTTSGNIELGNASDTTLSRSAAGQLAVEGVDVLTISNTKTVTNKRQQPRTASSTTASTLTPDLSSANVYYRTTQTATLTINAPTGTPVIGETIAIYVDSAGAQTLTMDSTYKVFGAAFPATTTAGKTLMITAQYNGTDWKTLWAVAQ